MLSAELRVTDTVARFGGDEFVILLQDFEPDAAIATAQMLGVAEKILAAVALPCELDGRVHAITCSIGATLFGDRREPVDDILRRADQKLYEAKRAGRDGVRVG